MYVYAVRSASVQCFALTLQMTRQQALQSNLISGSLTQKLW